MSEYWQGFLHGVGALLVFESAAVLFVAFLLGKMERKEAKKHEEEMRGNRYIREREKVDGVTK